MSIKIILTFQTKIDLDLLELGITLRLIRLIARVQFQTQTGWTREYRAILDTGSPTSIIPFTIWDEALTHILQDKIKLYGIGTKEGSYVSGKMGKVTLIFLDEKKKSDPLEIKAYLLDDDSIPFIIGFEDVLTKTRLFCDYKAHKAYLEI